MANLMHSMLDRHEIKDRLGHGGMTRIASRTGRTLGHVSQVINGKRPDRRVAVAVARALRLRLTDLPAAMYGKSDAAEERGVA